LAHVRLIDLKYRILETDGEAISYDYLILSAGSITHSFDIPGIEAHTCYLKTLEEAVALKNHIICCFEGAARETNEDRRRGLLTFVIVGGGATAFLLS
jgi:NADH dehydrogenase